VTAILNPPNPVFDAFVNEVATALKQSPPAPTGPAAQQSSGLLPLTPGSVPAQNSNTGAPQPTPTVAAAPAASPGAAPPGAAHSSGTKADELVQKLTSVLGQVQKATEDKIAYNYHMYSLVAKAKKEFYEGKLKRQAALIEAGASILLSIPFFFVASFIGKAASGAIMNAAPMIAKEAAVDAAKVAEAMKKLLIPTAAEKTIEEAFKEARKGLSKDCAAGGSVLETMAKYAKAYEDSLPWVGDALIRHVNSLTDISQVAAIYSAMIVKTPTAFKAEFEKYMDQYEKQVAPTFEGPGIIVNQNTGGSYNYSNRIAQVTMGANTYRLQVQEETVMGEPFVSPEPQFSTTLPCSEKHPEIKALLGGSESPLPGQPLADPATSLWSWQSSIRARHKMSASTIKCVLLISLTNQ